jgi:quinoprotein relay system zinc metallohydrolase 2
LPVVEVAPGVFVHQGAHEDFTPANRGGIANLAFVVGTTGVAAIDSGGSPAQARDLLAAIRARTDLPLAYVINTHDHPDHVLGNAVFAAEGAVVVGHARLPAAMATRGPFYLANMRRLLGAAAADAELVPPSVTVAVDAPLRLDLGGRELELRAWPVAHTGSDLTVLDLATGTLFAGDLLFMERLPVIDGSLTGWLAVLDQLAALPATRVVPGHGPPAAPWPAALQPQRAYREALRDAVRARLDAGRSLPDTVAEVPPPAASWLLRAGTHERNVTAAYTELEWE